MTNNDKRPRREEYYDRVKALRLKPTQVPTVWQTPDEQHRFSVPDPDEMDDDEIEVALRRLEVFRGE